MADLTWKRERTPSGRPERWTVTPPRAPGVRLVVIAADDGWIWQIETFGAIGWSVGAMGPDPNKQALIELDAAQCAVEFEARRRRLF